MKNENLFIIGLEPGDETKLNVRSDFTCEHVSAEGRIPHRLCVVLIVMFVGILLTMTIFFGISSLFGNMPVCDDYFDGEEHPDIVYESFSDVLYRNPELREIIVNYDYILFGNLPDENVIIGKDDFLFESVDKTTGYNYIADYIGYSQTDGDDGEIRDIARGIVALQKQYADLGVTCVVAVIPNKQTVYGEKMPEFFGSISENTRLSRLSRYIKENGITGYADTTEALLAAKSRGVLYNNTEESVNTLGAYYVYREIIEQFPEAEREKLHVPERDELEFVSHVTDGKTLARQVGLEHIIRNRTVSLSTKFVQMYSVSPKAFYLQISRPLPEYADILEDTPTLIVSFTPDNEWDRVLMTDYFSNSSGFCGYQSHIDMSQAAVRSIDADLAVVIVHEYELSVFKEIK